MELETKGGALLAGEIAAVGGTPMAVAARTAIGVTRREREGIDPVARLGGERLPRVAHQCKHGQRAGLDPRQAAVEATCAQPTWKIARLFQRHAGPLDVPSVPQRRHDSRGHHFGGTHGRLRVVSMAPRTHHLVTPAIDGATLLVMGFPW